MGLLRTLAIIILFYYAFKLIARLLLPFFAKYIVNKAQQNMQNQYDYMNQRQNSQEGEVKINTKTTNQHSKNQIDAEDVDFEEIKD